MSSQRGKNVAKYVIPTLLSNVCFFLFTIIDGIFVGNGVGIDALGSINIVFPMIMIVGALYMIATIGGVTVVAIRLGRKDHEGANKAFMHSFILALGIGIVFTVIGVLFTEELCILLGANETFLAYAKDYLFWYTVFGIPAGLSLAFQGICRNDGSPTLVSAAVIISTALNIFLDWLFIFPFKMGTAGAAIATGASQTVALIIVLSHFMLKRGKLRFHVPKLEKALFGKIILRGLPEGISQFAAPVMTLCTNLVLADKIGDIGINAFSVICYVASFTVAVFIGTSEGLQPLFGQSYGAKKEKDLKFYYRVGFVINIIGSVAVIGLIIIFCRPICSLFGADAVTLDTVVEAMPKYAWGFIPMSVNVMASAYLYSTKRSGYAICINVLRSFVISTCIIFALPNIFSAEIIWFTFGIYESLMAIVSVILVKHSERHGVIFK